MTQMRGSTYGLAVAALLFAPVAALAQSASGGGVVLAPHRAIYDIADRNIAAWQGIHIDGSGPKLRSM